MEANKPPQPPASTTQSKRWAWIGLVAIAVIVLVGWLILRPKADTATTIQITSQGFVPAQLTIPVGTEVTWTNTDSALHQVASNPYPANNSLPGLSSKGLLAGTTYSYTFKQPGTYGYHDQQNPTKFLGTIVVK